MNTTQNKFINREISWLKFNQRVLQEANDSTVPLIERIRFLGMEKKKMSQLLGFEEWTRYNESNFNKRSFD